jgi:hypothetical protein
VYYFSKKAYLAGKVITPNLWTEKEAPEETGVGKRMFRPNTIYLADTCTFPKLKISG